VRQSVIADATATALKKAVTEGTIEGVIDAETIRRKRLGTHHTATLVTLEDGRELVFDWHATLHPANPEVMPKEQWLRGNTL
jgi:hypothetical protein